LAIERSTKSVAINVLLVDWSAVGESASYMQIVASVPLMGEMVSQLIRQLNANHNLDVSHLRLIGHSVGAHVAGQAAHRLNKVGISARHVHALDPAGPFFRSPQARLDPSDADFVECWYSGSYLILSRVLRLSINYGDLKS
jgi:pancreatic triacylglycerol lipase